MFKINDYVVYGLMGICRIVDIGKDEYNIGDETEYYVLHPLNSKNMTIRVPVNNPKTMRATVTKNEVLSLIATMPQKETIWIDNEMQRANTYKTALKTGKPEEYIKIIKTLYLEKKARSLKGKKLTNTDEDMLKTAEKHLHEEFALALNISTSEVVPYILEHIPQSRESIK
ncbi:MAG: CarD family transcriptional regulator [Syntrophomonadaceae bacterium]